MEDIDELITYISIVPHDATETHHMSVIRYGFALLTGMMRWVSDGSDGMGLVLMPIAVSFISKTTPSRQDPS